MHVCVMRACVLAETYEWERVHCTANAPVDRAGHSAVAWDRVLPAVAASLYPMRGIRHAPHVVALRQSPRSAEYLIIAGGGNGHRGLGDTHVFDSAKRAWLEMGAL